MNRVLHIVVALACFAALSQLAVQAQTVVVDDGTNLTNYNANGQAVNIGGGVTPGITIDAIAGPVDIVGATTTFAAGGAPNVTINNATGDVRTNGPMGVNGAIPAAGVGLGVLGNTDLGGTLTANSSGAAGTHFTVAGNGDTSVGGAFTANSGGAAGTQFTVASNGDTTVEASLIVENNALVEGNLGVNGGETVLNGADIHAGAFPALGNSMYVDATSSRFESANGTQTLAVSNTGTVITAAAGHTVTVNSTTTEIHGTAKLYSGTGAVTDNKMIVDTTGTNIGSQFSGLSVTSATNAVSLFSDTDLLGTNARAALNMSPTSATLLVNTNAGVPHGLDINQTRTILSGGTNSTTLTLDDTGATFATLPGGGPARVHGVADGVAPFDAVNVRQLGGLETRMSSGIASVAALAAIPGPVDCKNYVVGLGYGNYNGESAVAVGLKANLPKSNVSLAIGAGFSSNSSATAAAGIGFSF